MSREYRISEGRYVLNTRGRDPLQNYPKRFWDVEIVETAGEKCERRTWSRLERRTWSTLARRNNRRAQ